jgi:hypothetical protein
MFATDQTGAASSNTFCNGVPERVAISCASSNRTLACIIRSGHAGSNLDLHCATWNVNRYQPPRQGVLAYFDPEDTDRAGAGDHHSLQGIVRSIEASTCNVRAERPFFISIGLSQAPLAPSAISAANTDGQLPGIKVIDIASSSTSAVAYEWSDAAGSPTTTRTTFARPAMSSAPVSTRQCPPASAVRRRARRLAS